MALDLALSKSGSASPKLMLNLRKPARCCVELDWASAHDLDAHAPLATNPGDGTKVSDFVQALSTYNTKKENLAGVLLHNPDGSCSTPESALTHSGDCRSGVTVDINEVITIDGARVPSVVSEIPIFVRTHPTHSATFAQVCNAGIRIRGEQGRILGECRLTEEFGAFDAVQMGSLLIESGDATILDLNKSQQQLVLSLQKAGISTPPSVDSAFVLDVSRSFEDEHVGGVTNALMTRLVPWGMTFDPDKKIDVFTFSHGPRHANYVGEVTAMKHRQYVGRSIVGRGPGWKCGTDYRYVIEKALEHFGSPESPSASASLGFPSVYSGARRCPWLRRPPRRREGRSWCSSRTATTPTRTAPRKCSPGQRRVATSPTSCSWVSRLRGGAFPFLRKIGDRFDSTAVFIASDIRGFVTLSDEELNEQLLDVELVPWLSR